MLTQDNIKEMIKDVTELIDDQITEDLQAGCYGFGETDWVWIFGDLDIWIKFGWTCDYYDEPANYIDGMLEYPAYTEADHATIKSSLREIKATGKNCEPVVIPTDELKQIFDYV